MGRIREWVKPNQLQEIKDILIESLGQRERTTIPFERVTAILGAGGVKDPENQPLRLIWSRSCREAWSSWGLHVGVRTKKECYFVKVVDSKLWDQAREGGTVKAQVDSYLMPELPPEEVNLIPPVDPAYVFPSWWGTEFLPAFQKGFHLLLTGGAGCGKTTIVEQTCALEKRPLFFIGLTQESTVQDLMGSYVVENGSMRFKDGPLIRAIKTPRATVLFDEYDACSSGTISMAIQSLLSGGKLFEPNTGQTLHARDDLRICLTSNTLRGVAQGGGLYSRTPIDEASLDRTIVFEVDYPEAHIEKEILTSRVPQMNEFMAGKLVDLARIVRQSIEQGSIYGTMSTRKLIQIGELIQIVGLKRALEIGMMNKITDDQEKKLCEELVQRVFGRIKNGK